MPDPARKAVRFVVRGRVQGVGFRFFAQRRAAETGVAGWVRNRDDGAVEGEAAGETGAVERFLAALRTGPGHAAVDEVSTVDLSAVPAGDAFRILG